jgi:hypothetical protein
MQNKNLSEHISAYVETTRETIPAKNERCRVLEKFIKKDVY